MPRARRIPATLALTVVAAVGQARAGGLIGHWRFDQAAGRTAKNALLAGADGTIHGAAWTLGKSGGALRFDGRDDYVALGDLGAFEAATLAFWLKPADVTKDAWQGTVSSDGWEAGVLHNPLRRGVVDVHLHLGGSRRGRAQSTKLKRDIWHHVAIAADTRTHVLRLFVNGSEQDTADIAALKGSLKLTEMVVGREHNGRYFAGVIDDVRIYDYALAEKEARALCPNAPLPGRRDPRNIRLGRPIPDESYADQPYVVVTSDGGWLCTMTTGPGNEGHHGQHIVATRSTDQGRSWSKPVDIEPSDGPEASWVVPLVVPSGRVYAFYTYNGDNVRTLRGKAIRADTIGWYAFRHSDDGGRTWSKQRYRLPMRLTACDRGNDWGGEVQIFWGIHKPVVAGSDVLFAFTKLGRYMLEQGEGWFFRSDNILAEADPAKLHWELLPEGDRGLRAPELGSVQEEHNIVHLGGRTFYCVYRTTLGYPCHAYSFDGCRTWTKPEFMTCTPGGRRIKTPRACPQLWRCANGRFLFWFHNHSSKTFHGRNPAWVAGGVVKDRRIHWSQPEILLYDPDPEQRMSYPGLIEQHGRTWVTETNKTMARVHEIDKTLLEGLWGQGEGKTVARDGLVVDLGPEQMRTKESKTLPRLDLAETGGLSLDLWVTFADLSPGQAILDTRDEAGRGIALTTAGKGAVRIELSDGEAKASWDSDPGLQPGKLQHIIAIVDQGPQIITFVIDGQLCDGGTHRQYGWGRYPAPLGDVAGTGKLRLARPPKAELKRLRVYRRYLRTSEAVAHFHAEP